MIQVTIRSFDGSRGVATAADGTSVAFHDDVCIGFKPEVALEVWSLLEIAVPGARMKESVLLRTKPEAMPDHLIFARKHCEYLAYRIFNDAWSEPVAASLRPVDVVRPFVDVPAAVDVLMDPSEREDIAARVARFAMVDDIVLGDFWPSSAFEKHSFFFDPCFVELGGADGDVLGLYIYPPALALGQMPIVFGFHESDPTFTWVAESAAHFRAVLQLDRTGDAEKNHPGPEAGFAHPLVLDALSAVDKSKRGKKDLVRERWLVGKIHRDGGPRANPELVVELRALYDRLGWRAPRAMLDALDNAAVDEKKSAWEQAQVVIFAELDAQIREVTTSRRHG